MGAKIDVWLDINSPYSRFAFLHLRKYSRQLHHHSVEYDIHPVFINGLNVGSGNKPPWTLPAKAAYGKFDALRAQRYFGTKPMKPPKEFPVKSLLALRSMCYVKSTYPKEQYESAFLELWTALWEEGLDIGDPEKLADVLRRHFSGSDVETILCAGQDEKWKSQLSANTEKALSCGAFGAPWFWARNTSGQEEPFFGSDRFHYMWRFLEIPHRDFEVLLEEQPAHKL